MQKLSLKATKGTRLCIVKSTKAIIKLRSKNNFMPSKKHPEYQYLNLLSNLVTSGVEQVDQNTGAKTYSKFGDQFRFDLSEGFPLLTTKRVWWKGVVQELYWFLSGKSNIKYLVDNNVHIWDDYPYKLYKEKIAAGKVPDMTKEAFIEKIKSDNKYAKKFGNLPRIYGELWRRWPASK